jgi:hypothetical protein
MSNLHSFSANSIDLNCLFLLGLLFISHFIMDVKQHHHTTGKVLFCDDDRMHEHMDLDYLQAHAPMLS